MSRARMAAPAVLLALSVVHLVHAPGTARAQATGSAVVQVVTEPELGDGTLGFSGVPDGELTLAHDRTARLTATALTAGTHESILAVIDPAILAAGYQLSSIVCDDQASSASSIGDVQDRRATFRIEDGETVTCVFKLTASSCICPLEGRWRVQNHPGRMVCAGSVNMTMPLAPSRSTGTLEIRNGCNEIVASGMSADEATIVMRAAPGCGFTGSVGGEEGGIPMMIHFTWVVERRERITGNLQSTVSQSGMTCDMSRTYELDFDH